ncbi:MAG: hypothetical protein IJ764_00695 [Bacteroidales bacterium]|nr:hypothetical protein [Bacteroidales bacterium]
MKKIAENILVMAVLISVCLPLNAQDKKENRPAKPTPEQVMERQCMKMVQQLGLDDKQAEKFATTYKAYRSDCDKVRQKYHPKTDPNSSSKDKKLRTDKVIDQAMKDCFSEQRSMLDLREKYYGEFRSFLSARQTEKLFKKECKRHDKGLRHGKKMGKGKGHKKAMGFRPNTPMPEGRPQPVQQQ